MGDVTKLDNQRLRNQTRVRLAMESGIHPLFIDEPNLRLWEMKPYLALAFLNFPPLPLSDFPLPFPLAAPPATSAAIRGVLQPIGPVPPQTPFVALFMKPH